MLSGCCSFFAGFFAMAFLVLAVLSTFSGFIPGVLIFGVLAVKLIESIK